MEDVLNLINICPTNPIQVLNLHGFFEDFVCVLQMILLQKKNKCWYWSPRAKTGSLQGIKQTQVINPKVSRGCPPLTANHISADCGKFTWTFNTIYSTGGLPYWGFQHYGLPIQVIHIRSLVKTRQSQRYKFKKNAKNSDFGILPETLHATHLLKLLDKMYKY